MIIASLFIKKFKIFEINRIFFYIKNGRETIKKTILFIFAFAFFFGFISSQTITVTSPHTGDTWYKGQTYIITWTKTGTMGNFVKIKLRNSTSTAVVLDIISHIPNNGSYSWKIPTSVAPGNYVIRVRTMDNAVYGDSTVFTIADPPVIETSITVTSPNGGETWYCGKTYPIEWVSKGCGDRVEIHVISGTEIVRTLKKSHPNVEGFNRYSWTISEYEVPPRIAY